MTTLGRATDDVEIVAEVREGEYGGSLSTVEPGGAEYIPLTDRHGTPLQMLWTWTSPNLEFATIFVGVLGVAAFGLSFWQAAVALPSARCSVRSRMRCCLRRGRSSACHR